MKWFRISLIELSSEENNEYSNHYITNRVPSSEGMEFYPVEAFTLYSNSQEFTILDALIGIVETSNSIFPLDWIQLSLDEARDYFTQIMGYSPTTEQVY